MKYPTTPEQFRAYLEKHSLSRRSVGELVGVEGRAVSYWKSGLNSAGKPIVIPYSVWFTLRTKVEGEPPLSPDR